MVTCFLSMKYANISTIDWRNNTSMLWFTGRHFSWHKLPISFILFTWCFGYTSGVVLLQRLSIECSSLLYFFLLHRSSFVGLIAVNIFPLLISAFLIRFGVPYLILPLALFKSFIGGYCSACILMVFGRAGWLISCLFLFSQSISNVVLLEYWIRNIKYTEKWNLSTLSLSLSFCFINCTIDYLLVRPFLIELAG